MKAIQLTDIRNTAINTVPDPRISSGHQVLIQMAKVGVCGSDIHYYTSGRIGDQIVDYPFTVGHECSGIVRDIGSEVQHIQKGDRVAVDPAMPCWTCDQCLAGRPHTCRKLKFLGCPGQSEGCLSQYLIMPESSCYPLTDNVNLEEAAVSEPLSIGIYTVRQSIDLTDRSAAILGFGPIGLSVLLAGKAQEGTRFYITDKIRERLQIAANHGAIYTGNPDQQDIVTEITHHEPAQLDVVYECCGDQDALDQGIDLLKPGGTLMLVGIPEADQIHFNINKLRRKEITIRNVRRQVDCVQPALNMISTGKIDVSGFVTHRFAFQDTQKAFDWVDQYKDGVMKAIIDMM